MLDLQQSSRMRLALGLLIACVVPAIFVPHWPWLPNSYILRNWVSVAACGSAMAGSMQDEELRLFHGAGALNSPVFTAARLRPDS